MIDAARLEKLEVVLEMVKAEVLRAMSIHPPMRSPHEGWATLREEVDELWEEVKRNGGGRDYKARSEATQCAAMGVRYVMDLCLNSDPPLEVCRNCRKLTKESHYQGNLTGDGGWWSCTRPAKPASEGGKVEYLCPYCGVATDGPTHLRKLEHGAEWTCNRRCSNCHAPSGDHELCERCESILKRQPAQPEPVAAEMPEAVSVNTWQLEELLKYADLAEVSLRTGFHPPEFLFEPADRSLRQCIDAIKEQRDQWRTHAVQPAPAVAMTPALEKVLESAELAGKHYDDWSLLSAVVAVRQEVTQAAEAGIKLPKVREGISLLIWKIDNAQGAIAVEHYSGMLRSMLAELDTAEGRK